MVSEDGYSTLGAVWIVVAVLFDSQSGHGWDGVGCVAFALEAVIFPLVYHRVDGVIEKALFLLLMDLWPGVLIRMVFVCRCRDGCGEVA